MRLDAQLPCRFLVAHFCQSIIWRGGVDRPHFSAELLCPNEALCRRAGYHAHIGHRYHATPAPAGALSVATLTLSAHRRTQFTQALVGSMMMDDKRGV